MIETDAHDVVGAKATTLAQDDFVAVVVLLGMEYGAAGFERPAGEARCLADILLGIVALLRPRGLLIPRLKSSMSSRE